MNIADIVALAKAGFKVSDIKELLAVEVEEQSTETEEPETKETESEPEVQETQDSPSVLEEIASLREQINALQKSNIQKEIVIKDTTEKTEEDVFSKFFK